MGDDIGARVRAVAGLPELIADLLGATGPFCSIEENDKAMEWALRAYRAGKAATPDRHDTADFWFKVAVNTAKRAGLPCPRCMHPTKSHWTDNQESRPGCHRGECLCSWIPQELLIAYEYEDEAATPDGPRTWALPDDAEATARIVVVVNRRRGSVHGMTADNAEAQRWTRELIDSYRDELAATQYVGLVKVGPGSLFVDALTDATPADESTGGAG